MKVINLYNHKGGVGKTTLCIHIAKKLSKLDNTLIIELDDQANVLIGTGLQDKVQEKIDSSELFPLGVLPLMQNINIKNFIYEGKEFDLIVNNALNGLEASLKEDFFEQLFNKIKKLNKYEYIIIDNPPSQYETVLQGLKSSTSIFIPFDCEDSSTKAVMDTLIYFAKQNVDFESVMGVIPNKYLHFHQQIHNNNIAFVNQAINYDGSKMKLYNIIKNSKAYKDAGRSDEYPELLDDVIEDIVDSKNEY